MSPNPFDFTDADAPDERRPYTPLRPATAGWILLFVQLGLLVLAIPFLLMIAWPLAVPAIILLLITVVFGVVWVARDARNETAAPAWVIVVFIGGPLGLLAYLAQRSD